MARRFMVEDRSQVSFVHRLAAGPADVEMSALQGRLAAQTLTDIANLGSSTVRSSCWRFDARRTDMVPGMEFAAARPAWDGEHGSQAR